MPTERETNSEKSIKTNINALILSLAAKVVSEQGQLKDRDSEKEIETEMKQLLRANKRTKIYKNLVQKLFARF